MLCANRSFLRLSIMSTLTQNSIWIMCPTMPVHSVCRLQWLMPSLLAEQMLFWSRVRFNPEQVLGVAATTDTCHQTVYHPRENMARSCLSLQRLLIKRYAVMIRSKYYEFLEWNRYHRGNGKWQACTSFV